MTSKVDICNMGLSHIGSDAVVTSIDPPDGSVESGHCARFYPIALLELLDWFPWTFAKKRLELARVTNPSQVWGYAYAVPSDCLNAIRVLQKRFLLDGGFCFPFGGYLTTDEISLYTERGSADFQIEGGVLLTNEPEAVLLYTQQIADPSKYTPMFNVALGYLLSSFLAGPLIKGREGAQTAATLRQAVFGPDGRSGLAGRAAMGDAGSSSERAEYTPDHIRARA